jgi:hypothetical protein
VATRRGRAMKTTQETTKTTHPVHPIETGRQDMSKGLTRYVVTMCRSNWGNARTELVWWMVAAGSKEEVRRSLPKLREGFFHLIESEQEIEAEIKLYL